MRRTDRKWRRWPRLAFAFVAVVAIVVATACSGQRSPASDPTPPGLPEPTLTTPPPPSVEGVFTITIEDYEYSHLAVPAGAQVNVVNRDDVEHTVTSDESGLFDVHVQPRSEQVFTAPAQPGTYPYHCTYHPVMRGELVVT